MRVCSSHAYNLPGLVPLPKGESTIGEMPAAARKYLDGLIKAGVVKVLDKAPEKPVVAKAPVASPSVDARLSQPVSVSAARDASSASGEDDEAKKRRKKTE